MEVIAAPTAAYDGVVVERVSHAEAGLIKCGSRRKSTQRNRLVSIVPQEPTVLNRRAGRIVLGIVKNGEPEWELVLPGLKVRNANPELQRQLPADLPGVLNESLIGVIGN